MRWVRINSLQMKKKNNI